MKLRKKQYIVISILIVIFYLLACRLVNINSDAVNKYGNITTIVYCEVIIFAGLLMTLSMVFITLYTNMKKENFFFILILCFGLLYIFVFTPLSGPDEMHHYQSTYVMSNYILGAEEPTKGYSQDFDYTGYEDYRNVKSAYLRIANDIFEPRKNNDVLVDVPGPYEYKYPLAYVLPVIGVLLARLLNLNSILLYLFGRFTNLLGFAFCARLAIKRTPKFKNLFGVLSILPLNLQQVCIYSYDGIIISCCYLMISSLLYSIFNDNKFEFKEFLWLLIPGLVQGPIKGVYSIVIFAAFLIPKRRFNNSYIKKMCVLIPLVLSVAAFGAIGFLKWKYIARLYVVNLNNLDIKRYEYSYIVTNTFDFLLMFLRTIKVEIFKWIAYIIGYPSPHLDINKSLIVLFGICILFSIQSENIEINKSIRITFLLIYFIICMLIIISMMHSSTFVDSNVITGVQGRYFIPVTSLLFIGCHIDKKTIYKDYSKALFSCVSILSVLSIIDILLKTIAR